MASRNGRLDVADCADLAENDVSLPRPEDAPLDLVGDAGSPARFRRGSRRASLLMTEVHDRW
jgi:hypothetical protein